MAQPAVSARPRVVVLSAITVLVGLTAGLGIANRPAPTWVAAVAAEDDPGTGSTPTTRPATPAHLRDVDLSVVPEPSTLSLFAFGSLLLLRPRRGRRPPRPGTA